jgi:hypothetical protein
LKVQFDCVNAPSYPKGSSWPWCYGSGDFFFYFCSRFPLFDSVGFIKCVNLLIKNDEIKNRKESTFSTRRMVSPKSEFLIFSLYSTEVNTFFVAPCSHCYQSTLVTVTFIGHMFSLSQSKISFYFMTDWWNHSSCRKCWFFAVFDLIIFNQQIYTFYKTHQWTLLLLMCFGNSENMVLQKMY